MTWPAPEPADIDAPAGVSPKLGVLDGRYPELIARFSRANQAAALEMKRKGRSSEK